MLPRYYPVVLVASVCAVPARAGGGDRRQTPVEGWRLRMRRDSTPPRRSGCEVDQVLDQVPVKYAGHLRLFHIRALAEERGGLVQVDADGLALLLGHAHAHRRAKSGRRPVLKEPVDDHGIADQIEPAVDRKPRQTLGRSLVELEEDRKLVVTGYLLEIRLDSSLITSLGHAGQLRQIDHSEPTFQGGRNFSERLFGPDRDELARKFGLRHLRFHYGYSLGSWIKHMRYVGR